MNISKLVALDVNSFLIVTKALSSLSFTDHTLLTGHYFPCDLNNYWLYSINTRLFLYVRVALTKINTLMYFIHGNCTYPILKPIEHGCNLYWYHKKNEDQKCSKCTLVQRYTSYVHCSNCVPGSHSLFICNISCSCFYSFSNFMHCQLSRNSFSLSKECIQLLKYFFIVVKESELNSNQSSLQKNDHFICWSVFFASLSLQIYFV